MIANKTTLHKKTTTGQRTAFNNKQSLYRIVIHNGEKTNGLIYVYKNERKTNM